MESLTAGSWRLQMEKNGCEKKGSAGSGEFRGYSFPSLAEELRHFLEDKGIRLMMGVKI